MEPEQFETLTDNMFRFADDDQQEAGKKYETITDNMILFAYDHSGSTREAVEYHRLTQEIFARVVAQQEAGGGDAAASIPNIDDFVRVLMWDHSAKESTAAELAETNRNCSGHGGTSPQVVAHYIKDQNFHGRLVLITDGRASMDAIDAAGKALGSEWAFSSVEVHMIWTGGAVNMSVSCPFTRAAPHTVTEYTQAQNFAPVTVVRATAEDMAVLGRIDAIVTPQDLDRELPALELAVRARTMGTTGDPTLRDHILAMKKRVARSIAASGGAAKDLAQQVLEALTAGDTDLATELAAALTEAYYNGSEIGWVRSVNALVGMCEGALRGAFDLSGIKNAIQGDRARRAANVAPPTAEEAGAAIQVVDGGADDGAGGAATLDGATVLAIVAGPAVLRDLDKGIVNQLVDCPLNALNFPDVVERIVARVRIVAGPQPQDVVLVPLAATEQACRVATYRLAKAFTGGKALGNQDLWFAVVWRLAEAGTIALEGHDTATVTAQLREQMRFRCTHHRTYISLTGLPELPMTLAPLGVAAWYVFAASALSEKAKQEPLRAHTAHADALEAIVDLCGYALPAGTREHLGRLRTLMAMLRDVKKDRHRLPHIARALTQASVDIERGVSAAVREREAVVPPFVPLDGPATPAMIEAALAALHPMWRGLPVHELAALAAKVNPSLSIGDIALPFDVSGDVQVIEEVIEPVTAWKHVTTGETPTVPVPICPATCRPYYTTPEGTWKESLVVRCHLRPEETVSCHAAFGNFVCRYGAFPTLDDLIVFLYNRCVVCAAPVTIAGAPRRTTLPATVRAMVTSVLKDYEPVIASGITPADFVVRWKASIPIPARQELEAKNVQ